MARSHGIIKVGIWADPDFRALNARAQRTYLMLISQPEITNCGVLPYTPKRWMNLARDETARTINRSLRELADARFVIVDARTSEILIRSFIKHDRIGTQPQLVSSANRQFQHIESDEIRTCLTATYPEIFRKTAWLSETESDPSAEGSGEGSADPSTRARAAPSPAPTPEDLQTASAVCEEPSGAQTLVAYFVDESRRRGSDPPRRVVGQVAKEIAGLIEEGKPPAAVTAGIEKMLDKGFHPSTLASCVHEAGLRSSGTRRHGGLSASEIIRLGEEGRL